MLQHKLECNKEFAFTDSVLFSFKYGNTIIPFSKVTFDGLLKRAAKQVCFSKVNAYSYRRGAHTNAYAADQDNLVQCAPRTLKTIGDHALTYHEAYVNIDRKDLSLKFASIKKLRVEAMVDSLPVYAKANLEQSFASINVRRAANAIISSLPVSTTYPMYDNFFQAPHLPTPDLAKRCFTTIHSAQAQYKQPTSTPTYNF